jgi:hypothetical protein
MLCFKRKLRFEVWKSICKHRWKIKTRRKKYNGQNYYLKLNIGEKLEWGEKYIKDKIVTLNYVEDHGSNFA